MSIDQSELLIKKFILFLRERNLSVNTIRAYRADLESFYSFVKSEFPNITLTEINRLMTRSYLNYLQEKKYFRTTIARKINVLRVFYRYLLKTELIKVNPLDYMVSPKIPKRIPTFLTEQEMNNLLNYSNNKSKFAIRDQAIWETMYSSGLRVSELVSLNVDDIDFWAGMIRVVGKGNKERIIPIGDTALKILYNY